MASGPNGLFFMSGGGGGSAGGGGGSALLWRLPSEEMGPLEMTLQEVELYAFDDDNANLKRVYTELKVPDTYVAGTQIKLLNGLLSGALTGDFRVFCQTAILKATVDLGSALSTHVATIADVAVTTAEVLFDIPDIDLTNAVGEINSVAVQPGDTLRIFLGRDPSSETSPIAGLGYLVKNSFEPKFTA